MINNKSKRTNSDFYFFYSQHNEFAFSCCDGFSIQELNKSTFFYAYFTFQGFFGGLIYVKIPSSKSTCTLLELKHSSLHPILSPIQIQYPTTPEGKEENLASAAITKQD